MNYRKQYVNLVRKAQYRSTNENTEKHHIWPKSIFGKNNKIVLFSFREHYVSHLLLWKYYKKKYGQSDWRTNKMMYAFWQMSLRKTIKSSKQYEQVRKDFCEAHSKRMSGSNHPLFGKEVSESSRELHRQNSLRQSKEISRRMSGENNPMFGKPAWNVGKPCSDETKKKISAANKGKKQPPRTEEYRKKLSERMKLNNPMKKKKLEKESTQG